MEKIGSHHLHILANEFERQKSLPQKFDSFESLQKERLKNPLDVALLDSAGAFFSQVFLQKNSSKHTNDFLNDLDDVLSSQLEKSFRKKRTVENVLTLSDSTTRDRIKSVLEKHPEHNSMDLEGLMRIINEDLRSKIIKILRKSYPTRVEDFLKSVETRLADAAKWMLNFPCGTRHFSKALKNADLKRDRVYLIPGVIAVKFPDREDFRDENVSEACVGLQVNSLRKECPNFVWTYGIARLSPPRQMKGYSMDKEYLCVLTEKIDGISLTQFSNKKSFQELFPIFVQIWFALAFARKIGLTHYDLHSGNAIIVELKKPMTIHYPYGSITTQHLVKIIDWGRSFVFSSDEKRVPIGRIIRGQNVRLVPNYFYDCYFILERTLPTSSYKEGEVSRFLKFFDVVPSGKIYTDMQKVANTEYDWEKWLDLIINCSSGKKYIRPTISKVSTSIRNLENDFTFNQLRQYLNIWNNSDTSLVKKQRVLEEQRLSKLINSRQFLTEDSTLPVAIHFKDPDLRAESVQDQFVELKVKIIEGSHSKQMTDDLERMIDIYRRRVEYLNRWLSFSS